MAYISIKVNFKLKYDATDLILQITVKEILQEFAFVLHYYFPAFIVLTCRIFAWVSFFNKPFQICII